MNDTQAVATAIVTDRPTANSGRAPTPPGISGYELVERIGVGGYGEVWRAMGPGGFPKAVKILYGQMDGPQAETELKSLNLMRELRHPFLLNVERVEFIEGRLVVVTELADHSLDEAFRKALSSGSRGIPRDELLAYLRDVADALDFMSEHHGLQHLDIKPDNLLIQGNHAKVGDFGLTKSVGLTHASIVNGFTPLYAPPELFEGQPSSNSDQYSLAIVYQVMLTGTPPFNGRTAAQLTSQHLRSTPDLSALPVSDRGVVARALAKNPHARFSGCRQFIDELARRKSYSGSAVRVLKGIVADDTTGLTQAVDPATFGKSPSTPLRPSKPLPPLPESDAPTILRPTLFIAVGGLGTRIISLLENKLRMQFGGSVPPSFGFMCLDSDRRALTSVGKRATDTAGSTAEFLAMPLRTPMEYRKVSSQHLTWLSRRWLFNIPRSGNVEGMRPLGRLAFVDFQPKIREMVGRQLKSLASEKSIAASVKQTEFEFSPDEVDICLIGSTSGGTSSGCLIDLGFLVRQLLDRSGRKSSQITAMLLHSTSVGGQRSDAQDANSCSFLKELCYFSLPGAQIPAEGQSMTSVSRGPFDNTFFVHLGDDLTTADYERHVEHLSAYLKIWSASAERTTLQNWRETERREKEDQTNLTIRTLGYASIDEHTWTTTTAESEYLVMCAVFRWLHELPGEKGATADGPVPDCTRELARYADDADRLLQSLNLSDEQIMGLVPTLLQGDLSRRVETYAASLWNRASKNGQLQADRAGFVNSLAAIVSQDAAPGAATADSVNRIGQSIRHELNVRMQQAFQQIQSQILLDVDSPDSLKKAGVTISRCLHRTEKAIAACSSQKSEVQQAFAKLCSEFMEKSKAAATDTAPAQLSRFCQQYSMLLVCQTACQAAINFLVGLKEFLVRQQNETLAGIRSGLYQIAAQLGRGRVPMEAIPDNVLEAFQAYLQRSETYRLSSLLRNPDDREKQTATLTAAATAFLMSDAYRELSQSEESPQQGQDSFPANAHPNLCNVGGGRRVLARIPGNMCVEDWKPRLQAEFGDCVSVRHISIPEVSVFCEVEGILVPAIVDSLTHLRPRVTEMAERVHSRNDISF